MDEFFGYNSDFCRYNVFGIWNWFCVNSLLYYIKFMIDLYLNV